MQIDKVDIAFTLQEQDNEISIVCKAQCNGKTGVEMEALTGCSISALTIYDMCKAVDKGIIISETKLLSKSGGKSDFSDPQIK